MISYMIGQYIPKNDADKLWEAWGKPSRLLYPCGHGGIVLNTKTILNDSVAFINKTL